MAKDRVDRDDEDLVRLYLTDIGQYTLLTKDDEVRLAKAIEAGKEAIETLDAGGKKVTLVGKDKSAGFDINPSFKWRYLIYLRQNKVMAYNDCDIEEISDGGVMVKTYDGYRFPVACDTVVVTEREANAGLKDAVQAEGIELFVIGDALVPRNLSSAVHDGYRIGLRI